MRRENITFIQKIYIGMETITMTKRKVFVMLALGAAVALCGCGSTSDKTNSSAKSETTSADESSSDEKSAEASTEAPDFEKKYKYEDYITVGEYKGIEYEKIDTTVTDKEVEENIQSTLEAAAEFKEDKTKKTVKNGDTVNIDYVGKVDKKEFDGGSAEGYNLEIGSGVFIEGFEEQLVGVKVGEEKTVKVTFPEDYQSEELAGKDAEFDVKLNYIGKRVVPELTDEYAKENLEAKSVEDYKKTLKKDLEENKKSEAETTIQNTIWNQVVENAKEKKEFPEDMVAFYKEQLETQYATYADMYGMKVDEFIKTMLGMTIDDCAKDSVKRTMLMSLIIDKENMTLSDKEYKEKLKDLASEYQFESAEEFEKANGKDVIEEYLLSEKLIDYLVSNAKEVKATTAASTIAATTEKTDTKTAPAASKAESESKTDDASADTAKK